MKAFVAGYDQSTQWVIDAIKKIPDVVITGLITGHLGDIDNSRINSNHLNSDYNLTEHALSGNPDVVFFLSSQFLSYDTALKILKAGCSVFIQNPFFFKSDEIHKLYFVARDHNSRLVFAHPYLHDHKVQDFLKSIKKRELSANQRLELNINRNLELSGLVKYIAPNVISEEYEYLGGVFHKDIYSALFFIYEFIGPVNDFKITENSANILPQGITDCIQVSMSSSHGSSILNISISKAPDFSVMSIIDDNDNVLDKINIYKGNNSSNLLNRLAQFIWRKNSVANVNKSIEKQIYDLIINNKDSKQIFKDTNKAIAVYELADKLCSSIKNKALDLNNRIPVYPVSRANSPRVLVTGATGALGRVVVKDLISNNYKVRALTRKLARNTHISDMCLEIFYGDIADFTSLESAFKDVDFVVHTAADTVATDITKDTSTINGTLNIIQLSKKYNIKRLVYISTCNVYGVSDYASGYHIDEDSPLEKHPEKRGSYTYTKLKAESLVLEEIKQGGINAVCIRPGTYFGENVEYFTPLIGFSYKNRLFITIGHKELILPLVCIDNVSSAILALLRINVCPSNIYNVIDDDAPTKKEYIDLFVRKLYPRALFLHVPFNILLIIILIQESFFRLIATKPFLTKYRFVSSQNNVIYESKRIHKELDWVPPYTLHDKMNVILERGNVGDKIGNI